MKKVAFICVHNSCRSQMAEGIAKRFRPDLDVYSAGTMIKPTINQDAVRIMKEYLDIDISKQYSKLIEDIPECDIYVSMGCNVSCPFVGKGYDYDFGLDDPTGKSDEEFVKCIEIIKKKVMDL